MGWKHRMGRWILYKEVIPYFTLMPPIVEISLHWQEFPPNGDPCSACGENIYGKMYVLSSSVGVLNTKLCEPCYELMQNEKDIL